MSIKTQAEKNGILAIGSIVAITLRKMIDYAEVGMSTKELDEYGRSLLSAYGAVSAPEVDYKFPGATCISINEEVCHGIPSPKKILKEGDLVNIDVSAVLDGYYGDNGGSFILGNDTRGLKDQVDTSKRILNEAIQQIKNRVRIADVGGQIERSARKSGYTVIKNLCGHGIGRKLHEYPDEIPCFKDRYNRYRFKTGMVIALETFISTKAKFVYQQRDGWTMKAKDNSIVVQHEHTLIVQEDHAEVVTHENGF